MRTASAMPAEKTTDELLSWSRQLVDSQLRNAVAELPESMRLVAGYHFGWWDSSGDPITGNSGKAIRPILTLFSAWAAGSAPENAIPAAVAVELAHNFSLLHDDVMDRDPTRRHRPTAWTVFGVSDAILAGDALLALAFRCLARSGGASATVAGEWLSWCVVQLCEGQSADLAFEQQEVVRLEECSGMAARKTGALLGCACALGALAGGGPTRQAELLREFGQHLGLAFQLVDDLLGIWGDPEVTGKPIYSDLTARKKSLPIVAALRSDTPQGRELAEIYRQPEPLSPEELGHAAHLVEAAGGRAWAQQRASAEMSFALERLAAAECDPDAHAALTDVAHTVIKRNH